MKSSPREEVHPNRKHLGENALENGLRVLARIIARVHMTKSSCNNGRPLDANAGLVEKKRLRSVDGNCNDN